MSDLTRAISRRTFLAGTGALAGAAIVGACGGDDGKDDASSSDTTGKLVLAQFFGSGQFAAGTTIRAPFGVADSQGSLLPKQSPSKIELGIYGPDEKQVGQPVTVVRRSKGLPRPYYALEVKIDEPGIYTAKALSGVAAGNSMAIEVSDPAHLQVVRPGQAMPALQTPTTTDPAGVTPICTRTPVCPLHDTTVARALTEKRPVGLIVASPAFCTVAICGPVLDLVLDQVAAFPQIRFVHAEVYTYPLKENPPKTTSPTINALGLGFEPVLYLTDANGMITQRLDSIFDVDELRAALAKV
jgi:hypothetical protein